MTGVTAFTHYWFHWAQFEGLGGNMTLRDNEYMVVARVDATGNALTWRLKMHNSPRLANSHVPFLKFGLVLANSRLLRIRANLRRRRLVSEIRTFERAIAKSVR